MTQKGELENPKTKPLPRVLPRDRQAIEEGSDVTRNSLISLPLNRIKVFADPLLEETTGHQFGPITQLSMHRAMEN